MEPITDFYIMCYHDAYEAIREIDTSIKIPHQAPKSITYVFDEEKSVRWNREQVELFNKEVAETRREAVECRAQSLRNLDKALVNYMIEYEAKDTTPRSIVEYVVRKAQVDHEDDWWNYLSDYLDFAEEILKISKEEN